MYLVNPKHVSEESVCWRRSSLGQSSIHVLFKLFSEDVAALLSRKHVSCCLLKTSNQNLQAVLLKGLCNFHSKCFCIKGKFQDVSKLEI